MEAYRRTRIPGKVDPAALAFVPDSVQLVNTGSGGGAGTGTMQWSHTVGYADNRLLVALIGSASEISSVTWGGNAFTQLDYTVGDLARCSVWYLLAPPQGGTSNIIVTSSNSEDYMEGGSANFTNVDQSTPLAGFDGGHGNSGDPGLTIAGAVGDICLGWIKYWDNIGSAIPDVGMTELFNPDSDGSWQIEGARKDGNTSVELGWSVATTFDAVFAGVMVKKA